MLLNQLDTSSLNRLIAGRLCCNNSSDTKSFMHLIMCNSLPKELHYDLDISSGINNSSILAIKSSNLVSSRLKVSESRLLPKVYHIFYATTSSDSVIYISAILFIYFILFSLLIYANWSSFNRDSSSRSNRLWRHRLRQLQRRSRLVVNNNNNGSDDEDWACEDKDGDDEGLQLTRQTRRDYPTPGHLIRTAPDRVVCYTETTVSLVSSKHHHSQPTVATTILFNSNDGVIQI